MATCKCPSCGYVYERSAGSVREAGENAIRALRLVIANRNPDDTGAPTNLALASICDQLERALRGPGEKPADSVREATLEHALEKIGDWAGAYPVAVFPEPDLKRAHEVLSANGISLDAISASNMRHVITQVQELVERALRGPGGGE